METPRISVFYRSLIVLAGVVLVQLLMLGFQLRTQSDIPLVRFGTVMIVEPIQTGMNKLTEVVQNAWFGYLDLRHAHQESQTLSDQLDHLKLANQQLEAAAEEVSRLRELLNLKSIIPVETVAARVLGGSAGESARLIMIDKGSNAGIKPDAPVIVPDGVVGKVLAVFPSSAQVILLTDPFSGAGVLLEQNRMHGVLKGRNEPLLHLDFIPNGEKIATGQRVFTSGEDKIYPPGLAVGVVEGVTPGAKFLDITVRPLAALQSLEEVLVILRTDFALPLPNSVELESDAPASPAPPGNKQTAAGNPTPPPAQPAMTTNPQPVQVGSAPAPQANQPAPAVPAPPADTPPPQ
jgi:rod shape-determining protein MreC